MAKKHVKHPKLEKVNRGKFARNELAILGTDCGRIKEIASSISANLSGLSVGYMDADHGSPAIPLVHSELTNKINHWQYNFKTSNKDYGFSAITNELDLLIINGNHEQGRKQIVVIDSQKAMSLKKRIDQLTDVLFVVTMNHTAIPSDIQAKLSDDTPVFSIDNTKEWIHAIEVWMESEVPMIYGLLLNGGKSTRMGQPKSELKIGEESMLDRAHSLLNKTCEKVYVSVANDNSNDDKNYIVDRMVDFGPYGGIISAFMHNPNVAWLVMAVDLPKVTENDLLEIINGRDPSKIATAFINESTNFPDPLLTLWEPKSYSRLLHFISLGHSCPRKVLINSEIALISPSNPGCLFNMNTKDDYRQISAEL